MTTIIVLRIFDSDRYTICVLLDDQHNRGEARLCAPNCGALPDPPRIALQKRITKPELMRRLFWWLLTPLSTVVTR
jgi:hypothetical protein